MDDLQKCLLAAELQAKINGLSVPGLYPCKDGLADAIRNAPHLGDELRASVLDLLPALPDEDRLCHGDFHPGNVMLTSKGVVVIDWMTASAGSPWADFSRTSLLLTIGPKAAGKLLSPLLRVFITVFHRMYIQHYQELLPDSKNERIEPERQALIQSIKNSLGM